MKYNQIYLYTRKDKDGSKKVAYKDLSKGLDVFNAAMDKLVNEGYSDATQAMHDDITFIRVCKLTKGADTIRLRLENIYLI